MLLTTAQTVLREWDRRGRHVFLHRDFAKLFPLDSPKTLQQGLNRLVKSGELVRACRGIYVNPHARSLDAYTLEHVAVALRRGEYNYVSLESALSEYGAISQIPVDRLTVMSTGRSGTYRTPYGVIEFTHTKRALRDLLSRMVDVGRPLRFATRQAAWADLKRVGRNVHLVDTETLDAD
ncbi:type IV toxin-antitoxin system AbiEi family antitoxin domain-containing protein [Halomonas sp. M5N1S17]|uniref:type IV toxin-antitoxin system AbiEi family antitoxin n=1 Tax=Halomonas alkalisoli TaxID=2907158 RepID=UPI001F3BF5A4|nr:type IV toxin-antitoxin system AbiEi family antitoxin domain-containing protein [Halomonas alkalisoli]MCE9663458.1 type IV toxin-antitoxin system AbiEi family antitoxin domain-containing protein [Halomonas alkalisoli]